MSDYDFHDIETRWQKRWADEGAFEVTEDPKRPKFYCLEMLPYPSGDIHVGHVRNYCITDVISRCKTMRGFNVMHPIGWDALGLPAENAAIKRGIHPEKWTRQNIAGMKRQLQRLGFSYPWSREIATCDPEYYRWNQWFFLRMLERGIAYRAKAPVNWCPSCLTVLANEQAEGGICWRCKNQVEQRDMEQWFLRITAYQDQLLDDMAAARGVAGARPRPAEELGGEVAGRGDGLPGRGLRAHPGLHHPGRHDLRRDLHGARPRAPDGGRAPRRPARRGRAQGASRPAPGAGPPGAPRGPGREGRRLHRAATPRTRSRARRSRSGSGNFVLMGYGTGAIMSVPAHDQRDFEFARKYGIEVRVVIQPDGPSARRGHDGGGLRRAGPGGEQRGVRRPRLRRGDPEDGRPRGGEGLRQGHDHLPPQGLAHQPPALLGHARSRSSTARRTAMQPVPDARAAGRPPARRALHRRGREPAREGRRRS